jgi:hypothetical protein
MFAQMDGARGRTTDDDLVRLAHTHPFEPFSYGLFLAVRASAAPLRESLLEGSFLSKRYHYRHEAYIRRMHETRQFKEQSRSPAAGSSVLRMKRARRCDADVEKERIAIG